MRNIFVYYYNNIREIFICCIFTIQEWGKDNLIIYTAKTILLIYKIISHTPHHEFEIYLHISFGKQWNVKL
jgi:hypothetical protein